MKVKSIHCITVRHEKFLNCSPRGGPSHSSVMVSAGYVTDSKRWPITEFKTLLRVPALNVEESIRDGY